MSDIYTIYGCGGFAREVMPILKSQFNKSNPNIKNEFYFIDDFQKELKKINNTTVLNFENLLKQFSNSKIYCCIAIADKKTRFKLTQKCIDNGISLISVISSSSIIMDDVNIGAGSIISPFVTITSNILIGKSFQANIYSYVAHDCKIGDFVTFAPGVKCNGNVHIEDGVYIGTGSIIYPGTKHKPLTIGKNSKIAAGSVVKKNVPENSTVIGNPAKLLSRELLKNIKK